jgi:hypothetical protein
VYKKPKIKNGISVPPMRGITEMNIFIQADEHQQGTHLVLIAKRLDKGGTMQPKNNLIRNGLHSILGEKKEMIVKVFLGPKNHGFESIDGDDAKRIAKEIRKIITLEEMKDVDPGELYGSMERVELQVPINLIRNGLHSILGEKYEIIVKVFLGPKNHGFVSVDGKDAKRIAEKINNIITLEEMKDIDPVELYGSMASGSD